MYLALGDPLQKRNFYRAGWLRFTDDADMPMIMTELSEKKVSSLVTRNIANILNDFSDRRIQITCCA